MTDTAMPGAPAGRLRLGDGLDVTLQVLGMRLAIVSDPGSGKTFTARALVEHAYWAGVPFAVVDPTDKWFGVRSDADGSPGGLAGVTVFGGAHGDLPLTGTASEAVAIADLVADDGRSVVVVTADLDDYGVAFVAAFLRRLGDRVRVARRSTLLVVDEADEYGPQTVSKEVRPAFLALDRCVRRHRADGLGVVLLTQRFAVLNKNLVESLDGLVVGRTAGAIGQDAVRARVAQNASREQAAEIVSGLASLPPGVAWWWLPGQGMLARGKVFPLATYDSSASPVVGAAPRPEARRAPLDLDALGARLAALAEHAADLDPEVLRARLAEATSRAARAEDRARRAEADLEVLRRSRAESVPAPGPVPDVTPERAADPGRAVSGRRGTRAVPVVPDTALTVTPATEVDTVDPVDPAVWRTGGLEPRIVRALAAHGPTPRDRLALVVGYAPTTKTFVNVLASLQRRGDVDVARGVVTVTGGGLDSHDGPVPEAASTSPSHWEGLLGDGPERRVLRALADAGVPVAGADLAAAAGYSPTTKSYARAVGALRRLGLAEKGRDGWSLAAWLDTSGRAVPPPTSPTPVPVAPPPATGPARGSAPVLARTTPTTGSQGLRAGARTMLGVLAAQHPNRLTRAQVATLSRLKVTGGTFKSYLGALRSAGYLDETGDGTLGVSPTGLAAAGSAPAPPATTADVVALWGPVLRAGARTMLDVVVGAGPGGVGRRDLADAAGLEVTAGTFKSYLGALRSAGLVDVAGDRVTGTTALLRPVSHRP